MNKTPVGSLHLVSLGCPKNRVDSEVMLGVAQQKGYTHTNNPEEADVIVINTCGFIDAAKKESIDTILQLAEHKNGRCSKLVVAGCLSQRHPDEMARELPEVDHFLGSSDMLQLAAALDGGADRILVGNPANWLIEATTPRALSLSVGSAYLKIAEGCNRKCSFCVIPSLRGKQRSRTVQDIVREAEQLAARGVVELNLISQDTIAYGRDLDPKTSLAELVERVAEVDGILWVRLFYLYPEKLDDRLVELLSDHHKVLPYIDMPLQHAADPMLRSMRRGHGGPRLRAVVERLRNNIMDLTFRTAFIVGHPGETDVSFEELCDFVAWAGFERIGVFRYSDEETSHSADLTGKVAPEVMDERYHRLMSMAQRISRQKNDALVGRSLEVLVDGTSDEHEAVLVGRHRGQAPEIDGVVYLSGTEYLETEPRAGQLVEIHIDQATDYDLAGKVKSIHQTTAVTGDGSATQATNRFSLRVLPSDNRRLS